LSGELWSAGAGYVLRVCLATVSPVRHSTAADSAVSHSPHPTCAPTVWPWRADARIRFELSGSTHGSTTVCWRLTVDESTPDDETIVRMRKRVNELINAKLRATFGQ